MTYVRPSRSPAAHQPTVVVVVDPLHLSLVDTRLSLVIGGAGGRGRPSSLPLPVQELVKVHHDEEEDDDDQAPAAGRKRKRGILGGRADAAAATGQQVSKRAACTPVVHGGSDDEEDGGDSGGSGGGARKSKNLRLTGEQAALLERSFHAHNILSHGEKHDLARRLSLQPRQVEVWFQNRRARTKLKQTEIDRELLRRWCERLYDENAQLRREIAEARCSSSSARAAAPCPSCSSKLAGVRMAAGG